MASYIPSTCDQRQEMLRAVGVQDYRALYADVPEEMYLDKGLPITYTRFQLGERKEFPMFDWEGDDLLEKDGEEERKTESGKRN